MVAARARHHRRRGHLRLLGDRRERRARHRGLGRRRGAASTCAGYSGMVNLETIGARIIEVHLRFADQWPDLYGGDRGSKRWCGSTPRASGRSTTAARRTGYSVVLFSPHGAALPPPAGSVAAGDRRHAGRLQPADHLPRGLAPERHAMPPGGFRVAIVNCWDRAAGNAAREAAAQTEACSPTQADASSRPGSRLRRRKPGEQADEEHARAR